MPPRRRRPQSPHTCRRAGTPPSRSMIAITLAPGLAGRLRRT